MRPSLVKLLRLRTAKEAAAQQDNPHARTSIQYLMVRMSDPLPDLVTSAVAAGHFSAEDIRLLARDGTSFHLKASVASL